MSHKTSAAPLAIGDFHRTGNVAWLTIFKSVNVSNKVRPTDSRPAPETTLTEPSPHMLPPQPGNFGVARSRFAFNNAWFGPGSGRGARHVWGVSRDCGRRHATNPHSTPDRRVSQ